jgi:hypothetical protein
MFGLRRPVIRIRGLLALMLVASLNSFNVNGVNAPAHLRSPEPPPAQLSEVGAAPLGFEPNLGQTHGKVKFMARAGGYILFLTAEGAVMALSNPAAYVKGKKARESSGAGGRRPPRSVVRMEMVGANPDPRMEGFGELPGRSNYFSGGDPARWQTDVPHYAGVRYGQVYPGVDLVFYGRERQLEYDFVVAPGADPGMIQLDFKGGESLRIEADGGLVIQTAHGELRQHKPFAYQEAGGVRREVPSGFVLVGKDTVGFQLGAYDPLKPLIIDPVLSYSSYLGGSGFDQGYGIAVDASGNAYVTGQTASADFPATPGAFQTNYGGGDIFVTKVNPATNALVYSTYITGGSGNAIAVDASGNAYVTGETLSTNFPVTPGAFTTPPNGFDTFIAKLNATGSGLVYSSRFGGNFDDFGRAIALDGNGNAYITGWTKCLSTTCTFPVVNAFQPAYGGGNNDAFVTKMNAGGSALVYSTFLGGGRFLNTTDDWGEGIAVDSAGSAYVTGYTYSLDFPVTPGAFQTTNNDSLDAFVTKLTPEGSALVYSTYLGGRGREQAQAIAIDAFGNAYVTGLTESEDNTSTSLNEGFPTTPGAFQTRGSFDAFVTKLNPQGSALVYSTYLGGPADTSHNGVDRGWGIAVDVAGNATVTGDTSSANFPVAAAFQPAQAGGLSDTFVTKLNAAGSALVYSTYLGGSLTDEGRAIALDAGGNTYATGDTSSFDFPTARPAQASNGGGLNNHDDAYLVKISETSGGPSPTPTPTPAPTSTPTPTPTPTPQATLASLVLSPSSINGGGSAQGTVTLSAPAPTGGATVTLASSNTSAASVPPSVSVPAGATSATFTVTTRTVTATTSATISASYAGVARAATLNVSAAPTQDTVTIQRAEYTTSKKQLRVSAASTSSKATLSVYVTATGEFIGTLRPNGGDQFSWPTNPQSITVRSSLGGSATKDVLFK